ncbi:MULTISPECIES: cob(I)yrinic acid a,c-diamide adenosyltransferase [unclassified Mesobacillus]|uniref:cob(I)yrinic acid a,c-diamide adenosyltransferase n=1 Tax=unclassified Mesobacillus TaxID=2675270 RepID=UPI002041D8D6|nr:MULTISPECIES: cob(I)yrinic acid a,c-diamide adenosyltransferase [unclassified Mesobacillus]MCM3124524.1 cob(I)yrinic acid a,c-diamide adenosyltransferase [Mesobacillus sp. MER 33]MCM3234766.1 cob(I)yrinic acid a,c-diamide adenosyltransferase [Mesobacillus sp. MER 48]
MKIYTKTGDKGTTSLIYGTRVAKNDMRVEAYGTCDETNSMIGLALSYLNGEYFNDKEQMQEIFHKIQTVLFHVGAELATPPGKEVKWVLEAKDIEELEKKIDDWDAALPQLTNFILPGGHQAGAALHVARTVARRAERQAVELGDEVNPLVLSYLNRLSDFLFVAARYVNMHLGAKEQTLHQG